MKAVLIAAALLAAAGLAGPTLENDALRIRFADADAGYSIAAIENRLVGDVRFVNPASGQAAFWRLDLVRKGAAGTNEHVSVDNFAPAVARNAERTAKGLRFVWKGMDVADERGVLDVFAEVVLPPGEAASEWRIAVSNRSVRSALHETAYPLLKDVTPAGKGDWFVPYKALGARLKRSHVDVFRDEVNWIPSWHPPVAAFNLGEAGLYFAAHDPEQRIKKLMVGKGREVRFETPVEDAGIVGKAAEGPRHAVTIAAYRGDWWRAAKLYRAWALKQRWAAKGPIAKRSDYPKALADMDLLFRFTEGEPMAMSNNLAVARRIWPDLKLGAHWYRWTPQIFCVNYPEFFPARPYVGRVTAFARRQGITLFPYVDVRSWDMDMVSWIYARQDAVRDMEGRTSEEVYAPRHRLAVMCPGSGAWREAVAKLAHDAVSAPSEAINGAWFGGIYYDQTACSRPVPCFAPGHSHPKGGGGWWADGHRRAHAAVHAWCARRGAPIFSEGTGDMCLDQIDGYLKASGADPDEVPFFTAVYAGYAISFGNYQSLRDPDEGFRAYQMRDFTSGVLLGWLDRFNVTSPEFASKQKCLGMLARARRAAAEFMVYGTLEDELRFTEKPPQTVFDMNPLWRGKPFKFTLPAVTGTFWRNLDRTGAAIVAANASDQAQTVRFRLPCRGFALQRLPGTMAAEYREEGGVGVLALPPASPAYLVCRTGEIPGPGAPRSSGP